MQRTVLPSENNSPSGRLAALVLTISTQSVECVLRREPHDLSFFLDPERECWLMGSSEESGGKRNVVRALMMTDGCRDCIPSNRL
jgi:hypothetical protein